MSAASSTGDELSDRTVFTNYVKEIAAQQRATLANRVVKIAAHQRRGWDYLFGTLAFCNISAVSLLWAFGPRNIFSNSSYVFRVMGPATGCGICLYFILWQGRMVFMKFRFWALIEDYEYDLRRVKAHHVPEGATHLAWLEFVLEQVKADRTTQLDPDALRKEPRNIV